MRTKSQLACFAMLATLGIVLNGSGLAYPVLQYDFNEPAGSTSVRDSIYGLRLGVLANGEIVTDASGQRGNVLHNNAGTSPGVQIAVSESIAGSAVETALNGSFTIEGVFRLSAVPAPENWATLFKIGRTNGDWQSDSISAHLRDAGASFTVVDGDDDATPQNGLVPGIASIVGEWFHVALTYDRHTNRFGWFVDGVLRNTWTPSGTVNGFDPAGTPAVALLYDPGNAGADWSFDGDVAWFRISDEVLYADNFATVGKGGVYTKLWQAVANMTAGQNWADGDDTITLLAGTHFTTGTVRLGQYPGGEVTLRGDDWNTVYAWDESITDSEAYRYMFRHSGTTNTFNYEGIIFTGAPQVEPGNHVWAPWSLDAAEAGDIIVVNIKECIVTRALGTSNATLIPDFNFISAADPVAQPSGTFRWMFDMTEVPTAGKIAVNISDSTFAFMSDENGSPWGRASGAPNIMALLRMKQTLIVNTAGVGIHTWDVGKSAGYKGLFFDKMAFAKVPAEVVSDNHAEGLDVSFTGAIFADVKHVARYAGAQTFELRRATLDLTGSLFAGPNGAGATIVLEDLIFTSPTGNRLLGLSALPASLTINNVAFAKGGPWNYSGEPAGATAAMSALYGGSGPLIADPQFVSGKGSYSWILDGRRGWESGDNVLFDVLSPQYFGKGTSYHPANMLAGGADAMIPVGLSAFTVD